MPATVEVHVRSSVLADPPPRSPDACNTSRTLRAVGEAYNFVVTAVDTSAASTYNPWSRATVTPLTLRLPRIVVEERAAAVTISSKGARTATVTHIP